MYKICNKTYVFDAFDSTTNTIYEFYGDYWHGNPNVYDKNDFNKKNKKTFGELYEATINRENYLKSLGFNLIFIWESDFEKKELI